MIFEKGEQTSRINHEQITKTALKLSDFVEIIKKRPVIGNITDNFCFINVLRELLWFFSLSKQCFFYFKTYLRYFVQINQLPPEVRAKSKDYVLWRLISQCDILPFRACTEKFCLLLCILSSILSRYISPSPPLFPVYPEREGRERREEERD